MKKLLIFLIAICCCGCTSSDVIQSNADVAIPLKVYVSDPSQTIFTVDIEGHTYLIFEGINKAGMVHAEHCSCKKK